VKDCPNRLAVAKQATSKPIDRLNMGINLQAKTMGAPKANGALHCVD
jgi:hypothetical protein